MDLSKTPTLLMIQIILLCCYLRTYMYVCFSVCYSMLHHSFRKSLGMKLYYKLVSGVECDISAVLCIIVSTVSSVLYNSVTIPSLLYTCAMYV
jgi:hypothetical protein